MLDRWNRLSIAWLTGDSFKGIVLHTEADENGVLRPC